MWGVDALNKISGGFFGEDGAAVFSAFAKPHVNNLAGKINVLFFQNMFEEKFYCADSKIE